MTSGREAPALTMQAARRLVWLLVVPVLALLAVLTLLQYRQRLQDAERDLLRRSDERAQELDAIARPAMAHVHDLRRALEDRWSDPPDAGPALRQALAPRQAAGAPDGWSLDDAPEAARQRWGQVWWASLDRRPPDALWLRRAQAFLEAARVVHQRAPGFEATWFAAAELNLSFGYPWVATSPMLASMGLPSVEAVDAPRRAGVERAERDLAKDPADTTFWGPPYISQLNGELVMSHGAMVVVEGRYRGEVSLDFRLDELQRIARHWQEGEYRLTKRVWLTDRHFNILADATQPLAVPPGQGLADTRVQVALPERLPTGLGRSDLVATLATPGSVHHGGGWVLVAAARSGSPWVYVQAVPESALRAAVLPTLLPNALLGLALLGVVVAGQWLIARWLVTPALGVLAYLRQLSTDPAAPAPQLGARWRGWVDAVSETFRLQQEAARQIERQRDALRQSEKLSAMGTLLAGVAHELNNPLAIVMGRASLLEEKTEASALAADARRIREAAERCGRIVRTFLNMARQKPPERRAVQLNDIVRAAADMLGYTLRSHGITVDLALADDMPVAQADPDQLGQVVLNLIVNAQQALGNVDAARQLTLATGVELARPGREPRVWLRVADTGPGVPEEARARIFEPFFTTKGAGLGTGLGLSVSRAIVREHGGELTLEPHAGGASFRLSRRGRARQRRTAATRCRRRVALARAGGG
jgi:signal transduction histidine kinase